MNVRTVTQPAVNPIARRSTSVVSCVLYRCQETALHVTNIQATWNTYPYRQNDEEGRCHGYQETQWKLEAWEIETTQYTCTYTYSWCWKCMLSNAGFAALNDVLVWVTGEFTWCEIWYCWYILLSKGYTLSSSFRRDVLLFSALTLSKYESGQCQYKSSHWD